MKLVHQALSAHPHSQPYPRLTRFNSHRSAAPDKAASFKSLYLNRPAEDQAAQSVRTVGGPDTALRLVGTGRSSEQIHENIRTAYKQRIASARNILHSDRDTRQQ